MATSVLNAEVEGIVLVVVLVLVLLLVLVFENSAYLAAKVTKDLGLFSAPKPRIEHEHDDEHEHDSPNFEI
ncbi:MAG: hypothetical protein JO232_17215 [Verrucomicrobia bacterium]|nr:hypothetical protein [Verrucomicrobiota bacterium]